MSCHRFHLALGDLERYREQDKEFWINRNETKTGERAPLDFQAAKLQAFVLFFS